MPDQGLRVEALGVAGAPAPGRLTTTFRLSGGIVVDTGAATHGVPVGEQLLIGHVLLSHAHLDHTLGVPFLLAQAEPRIIGLTQTLDAVRSNLLDGHIWPDLSDRARWQDVTVGYAFEIEPWEVEVGPANHTVPCITYLFKSGDACVAIVGDTRYDETVVSWIADRDPTDCIFEVSFSDAVGAMARRFGHQTARDVGQWRLKLGRDCRIHITHVKPDHEERVQAEIGALDDPNVRILRDGDVVP